MLTAELLKDVYETQLQGNPPAEVLRLVLGEDEVPNIEDLSDWESITAVPPTETEVFFRSLGQQLMDSTMEFGLTGAIPLIAVPSVTTSTALAVGVALGYLAGNREALEREGS